VADFSPSPPHFTGTYRLTLEQRASFPHAWTADSNAVIFESDRNGSWDIFKQRIDQRTAESPIAAPRTWEVLPQLAPDGQSVLYEAGLFDHEEPPYTLMRISLNGGTPEVVPTGGPLDEFRCAYGAICVLRTTADRQHYVFRELDPVSWRGPRTGKDGLAPLGSGGLDALAGPLPSGDPQS